MTTGESSEAEQEPLIDTQRQDEEVQHWDIFRNKPGTTETGSATESRFIDKGVKFLKMFTVFFTFTLVLSSAVISKGTLLFMTSQIKKNVERSYCNKNLDIGKQFVVVLPDEERAVWIWLIIFTFMVPELGTFTRSVKIILFKKWKYPTRWEFLSLFITESLPTIGSALLVILVLPELDVIKGAMLTNAVCFIPGIVACVSTRNIYSVNDGMKIILDAAAIVAQASAFVVWPLVVGRRTLFFIPLSLLFISFGWWENFISEKSSIAFIKKLAKEKKYFKNSTYFMHFLLAPWKCLLFFATTVVIIIIKEGNSQFLFDRFLNGFRSHSINITEFEAIIRGSDISLADAVTNGPGTIKETSVWTPISFWLINVSATYICYISGKFACKIMIQTFSFAFPITISVPVLLTALIAMCGKYNQDVCIFSDVIPPYLFFNTPSLTYLTDFIAHQYSWIWLIWLLSQTWITIHVWTNNNEKLASTEELFFKPMYDAYLIDQSITLNRRRMEKSMEKLGTSSATDTFEANKDKITRIYGCGTMWHETKEEMIQFLKSILRMDEDQCAHRTVRNYLQYNMSNYYEFETHILFDDAYVRTSQDDQNPQLNQYVLNLMESVSIAAFEIFRAKVRIRPPVICSTPYGGRLIWTLPGKTKMIVHLKDKAKTRPKKRWSQVMYMYYLLGYRLMENKKLTADRIATISDNTFLLALDGDMDFQPRAVHLLVDCMKKNKAVGATCGRIHPVGLGFMTWYQTFEYASMHWLQKSTEHIIGCVLCSPGCFSLFRANALMDDNVMAKYATVSEEATHYLLHDQGEDRWLSTLLLKKGYRVEYCAASDAYTHCPEGFNDFFVQRRRWGPSTIAHNLALLINRRLTKVNENMSRLYILYQAMLMIGTITGPGAVFLMLMRGFAEAFQIDLLSSLYWNTAPILLFVLICATCKSDIQLFFAGVLSGLYGLIMMVILIGLLMQIQNDGWLSPSTVFLLCIALLYITTGLLHPQEIHCLKYGIIYYVAIPSVFVFLFIYFIFNMNNVSWGTREITVFPKSYAQNEAKREEKPEPKTYRAGCFESSCASTFKAMCCTHQADGEEKQMLENIQTSLIRLEQKLDYKEQTKSVTNSSEPTTEIVKATNHTERYQVSRAVRNEQYGGDSMFVPSAEVQENSLFYDGELIESVSIDKKEEKFWQALIDKYLHPVNDTQKKDKLMKELKDLRDKMVITFFMINSLFVLVVFLLTSQEDVLYAHWPLNPKVCFTYHTDQNKIYIEKTYIQLDPISFLFLICFAVPMSIQFFAMLYHRFSTFSHIMATTADKLDKTEDFTDELVKTFKKIQRFDDGNDEMESSAAHRNTVHTIALNRQKKAKHFIEELDEAFSNGMKRLYSKFKDGPNNEKEIPISKKILRAIRDRRNTVIQRRTSQIPHSNNLPPNSDNTGNSRGLAFDNLTFEEENSF